MTKFKNQVRITEIFYSLQGESTTSGLPTLFIRLTGCPLRCQYCDTDYAFHGGQTHSIDSVLSQIKTYNIQYICVTGGEPLAQPGCLGLMALLCDEGYFVSIETSGAIDISQIDPRVMIVMDIKTPGSKEDGKNLLNNITYLKAQDQVKFVICNREDYEWSREMIASYQLTEKAIILFSPSWNQQNPTELAEWIIQDQLNVRFQLQLHKILWNDKPGH